MKGYLKKIIVFFLVVCVFVSADTLPAMAEDNTEGNENESGQSLMISDDRQTEEAICVGDQITISAEASGGAGDYQYQFELLKDDEEYEIVQSYGQGEEYIFEAKETGKYSFRIIVQDSEKQSTEKDYEINVIEAVPDEQGSNSQNPLNAVEETAEKPLEKAAPRAATAPLAGSVTSSTGTQANVQEAITLTTSHIGGRGEVTYRFTEVYNGKAKTVQNYSAENTYQFTAKGEGLHQYNVSIRDDEGQVICKTYKITVVIPASKKLTGSVVSSTGTQANVQEAVTLTASHTGGYGEVTYRFTEVYNGKATTIRNYETRNYHTFLAKGEGVHQYNVSMQDSEGQVIYKTYKITVVIPSNKRLTGSIKSSTGTKANVQDTVTLTASNGGGYGEIEYRFTEIYNGKAVTVQNYSKEVTYNFTAKGAGVHQYNVSIRDSEGQVVCKSYKITVVIPSNKRLAGDVSANTSSATIGNEIKITGKHTGGYDDVEYRFTEIYNGNAKTVQNYSAQNTYSITASGVGLHQYNVSIRDGEGQVVCRTYKVNVVADPAYRLSGGIKSNVSASQYVGKNVILTASHKGGYGQVQYRFTEVYNGSAKTVQNYSANNQYALRTTKPGVHTYNVSIKDEENQVAGYSYKLTVVVHPNYKLSGSVKKNVSGTIKVNQSITLTATASKGYGAPYLYRFTEVYNGKAKTVQSYSTDNTYTFKITGYGTHKFNVAIQDCEGQTITKSISLNLGKNGWYYEGGYKFYYKNNVKQLDLDGILPKQSSYYIKVNRKKCTVTVYAKDGNKGYIIPVKRFACSVGLPSTPTPKGTFYTSNKYRWHTLMGPSYGQYCTRIVGGILFHSVAGRNKTSYNLNAANYNKLGQPASHGCVRLCVRDAKWIYDNCKSGTKVTIYDSSNPGPLGKPATIKIPAGQTWDPTDPNV